MKPHKNTMEGMEGGRHLPVEEGGEQQVEAGTTSQEPLVAAIGIVGAWVEVVVRLLAVSGHVRELRPVGGRPVPEVLRVVVPHRLPLGLDLVVDLNANERR
jgi:hypothetical protein